MHFNLKSVFLLQSKQLHNEKDSTTYYSNSNYSASHAQSGAKIELKSDTVDYGTTSKENDNGKRSFEFTNTGDAPLIIKDVKSTCGCTVPTKPKEPIAPGKTGEIEVKYNMNPGPIRKILLYSLTL